MAGKGKGCFSSGHRSFGKLQLPIRRLNAGRKSNSIHHSPPCLPEQQQQRCRAPVPSECLPAPREVALAAGRQLFVGAWQGAAARGTLGSPACGDGGCSDYSPSVLINLTPSSVLIQIILWEAGQAR